MKMDQSRLLQYRTYRKSNTFAVVITYTLKYTHFMQHNEYILCYMDKLYEGERPSYLNKFKLP